MNMIRGHRAVLNSDPLASAAIGYFSIVARSTLAYAIAGASAPTCRVMARATKHGESLSEIAKFL